jgi:thiosulfate/3-mercaptopyruvate sulfurtransferase
VRTTCLAVTLAVAVAPLCLAQRGSSPRNALLISTGDLAAHLADPHTVLLHVGEEDEYRAKHLPGARFMKLEDISDSDRSGAGLMLEMPSDASLRDKLASAGISDDSRIIIYYGDDWVSPATRVYHTLEHAGLGDHTRMLDGSMQQWIREGRPVTDVVPARKTGTLSPLHPRANVVTAEYVKAHIGKAGVSIVDGRSASFYDGVQAGRGHEGAQRSGHIAGAKSVPFESPYGNDNRLLPNDQIAAIFAKAGIAPADTVVGYCHIGQQATAMLFAARAIGHPVLLYDGSFEDWSRRPAAEYPVESPAAKGKP